MVNAKIEKGVLDKGITVISALVDEAKLRFTSDGLEINAIDPSDAAMGSVKFETDAFESYDADGQILGVNLNRFQDVIGLADSGDVIALELDEDNRVIETEASGMEFNLALVDPDSIRQSKNPDVDLPASFELSEKALSKSLKAADMVSDTVEFKIEDNEFYICGQGDTDDFNYHIEGPEISKSDDFDVEDIESRFDRGYINKINSPIPSGAMMEFAFGGERPLEVQFTPSENVSAKYFVAPRINSSR